MKRCFFIGHRDAREELVPELVKAVERLVSEHSVTEFIAGHYGNFDSWAAEAVRIVKQNHPRISLVMLLPYHPAIRPVDLPDGFDASYYPFDSDNFPKRMAIVRANRYMIDHADFVIAYVKYPGSNSMKFLEYAQRRSTRGGLKVVNLADENGWPAAHDGRKPDVKNP